MQFSLATTASFAGIFMLLATPNVLALPVDRVQLKERPQLAERQAPAGPPSPLQGLYGLLGGGGQESGQAAANPLSGLLGLLGGGQGDGQANPLSGLVGLFGGGQGGDQAQAGAPAK